MSRSTLAAVLAAALTPALASALAFAIASVPAARLRAQPPTSPPRDTTRDTTPLPRDSTPPRAARRAGGVARDSAVALPGVRVTGTRRPAVRYGVPNAGSATRTNTPLLEIPQAVQVVTRALIEEQDRRTLGDVLTNVSGAVPSRSEEALLAGPIVRGFPAEIYQDGLPMYVMQAANDPTSLVGVQRIEVLKGPTATLFGGGIGSPLGGLINVESTRPDSTRGGFLAMRAGSFATVNPYGELNVPLGSNVAARVAGEYQRNGSNIDRVEGDRWFVQPSVAFRLGARTDLVAQGQFSRRSQLEYSGVPAAQALAGAVDRHAFPGAPIGQPRTTITNAMTTATLRHTFARGARLTVGGRYFNSRIPEYGSFIFPDLYPAQPATPTVYPILPLNMLTTSKEGTFDANVAATADVLGGRHAVLGGVSYDQTRFYSDMAFTGETVGAIDLAAPTYTLAFGAPQPASLTQTDRYETAAAYVQDQATYGRLHLTGSLRYTRLGFREAEQSTRETYHRVSPRIGATVDVVPGVALYAGYATSFRGAFGLVGQQAPRPETSRNVEGGLKFARPRADLSGTVAVFQQTRDNVATPDPADLRYSVQVGQQRARGVEADLTWEPTPAVSLLGTYAYTDAEVTRDNALPVGDGLPRVPRHSGRVAAHYRVLRGAAKGLSFGPGLTAFSSREITLPNSVSVPGYAAVDAQAAYDVGRYTLQVSAVNLTGRKAFDAYKYFNVPVVIANQPRSAYLTLKARL